MPKDLHMAIVRSALVLVTAVVLPPSCATAPRGPEWFSAWTASHNIGEVVPEIDNTTVRMIVRPTISGQSLRIKLENTRAKTPATFSGAYVGVSDSGAAVVPGTNKRLSFRGAPGLTLAPTEGAWSDPVTFEVKAFQKLAVSLDVASASDVSMHALGLVTNYAAEGVRAEQSSGNGFAAISRTVPGSTVVEYPFYWLAAVDVMSSSAVGTIVAFGDSWVDGRCSTTENNVVRPGLYQRWIDVLAARLAAAQPNQPMAVVNAGIAGNCRMRKRFRRIL